MTAKLSEYECSQCDREECNPNECPCCGHKYRDCDARRLGEIECPECPEEN